jgi:hypothetical protein
VSHLSYFQINLIMETSMREACQRCHELDEDRRTLWMDGFYNMLELDIPFKIEELTTHIQSSRRFFTLRVCKQCRAEWLIAIECWFKTSKVEHKPCGSGIYIREFGSIREISDEEWYSRRPDTEPVRCKPTEGIENES